VLIALPALAGLFTGAPFHFDYPVLKGFNFKGGMTLTPEFMALVTGLTVYVSAFNAEIIRSGIQSVSKGQTEAGRALSMSEGRIMRKMIRPQALRIVLPPMVNNFIGILKDTSLVGIIGLIDLLQVAFAATSNPKWLGKIEEAYLFVALFYWIMCYSLSKFSRVLEERYQL
jgi:general L-amino acid transport system permease protein